MADEDLGFVPEDHHDDLGFVAEDVGFVPEPAPVPRPATIAPETSALYGAAEVGSFGFSDELLAHLKAAKAKYMDSNPKAYGDLYAEKVRQERDAASEARKQNPKSYLGGGLAAGIGTSFIPGLGIARGAGFLGGLGRAAAQGALMGAGTSEINPLDSPERAQAFGVDVAKGAGLGAATHGAFSGIGSMLGKFSPSALSQVAEERAVKAATGQNIGALRKIANISGKGAGSAASAEDKIRRAGRDILEERTAEGKRVLAPFDNVGDLAPKLTDARQKYGQQISEVSKSIDAATPNAVDAKAISDRMLAYASEIPETEAGKRLQKRILADAANFEKRGTMSFEDAQKFKNQFKYKPVDSDALIGNQEATNKIKGIIGSEMDNTAEKMANSAGDPASLIGRYKDIKGKYGSFAGAADASTDRVLKDLSNRFISPSDYGVGMAAAVKATAGGAGGLAMGALGAVGNKLGRTRGSSAVAVAADSIAKTLEKSPGFVKQFGTLIMDATKRGPAALTATHNLLMKKPEYRAYIEENNTI